MGSTSSKEVCEPVQDYSIVHYTPANFIDVVEEIPTQRRLEGYQRMSAAMHLICKLAGV